MTADPMDFDWLAGPVLESGQPKAKPRTSTGLAGARHRRNQLPCVANLTTRAPLEAQLFTLEEVRAILADPVRDKRYLETTLGPHVADFLNWKRRGRLAQTTLDNYESILAKLAILLPSGVGLEDISAEDLALVQDQIPQDSWVQHRKIWNVFFTWAIDDERRPGRNPVKRLPKLMPNPQRVTRVFNETERDMLVAGTRFMDDPIRDKARAMLVLDSGCRKGELMGLQVWDINAADRLITVIGKGDKQREIPVYGDFWLAWENALLEPIPKLGRLWRPDDYVWFPMRIAGAYKNRERQVTKSYPDRPMSDRAMHEWWERLVGHSGIPYRRLHTTRHTYLTAALDASDGDVYGVQQLAGHASIRTTERYLHSSKRRKESVAKALARVRRIDNDL